MLLVGILLLVVPSTPLLSAPADPTTDEVRALLLAGDAGVSMVTAMGRAAGPALQKLIEDPVVPVRRAAVRALGRVGRGTVPATRIVPLLDDDAPSVTWAAADALGVLGDREAVPRLSRLLVDRGRDYELRTATARALARIGDPRATRALLDAVAEREAAAFRDRVGHALLDLAAAGHADRAGLETALGSDTPAVKAAAAGALALAGHAENRDTLLALLDTANEGARALSEEALRRLGSEVEPLLIARLAGYGSPARRSAIRVLGALGSDAAISALISRLDDPAAADEAARALGRHGGRRVIEPLARALEPAAGFHSNQLLQRGDAAAAALSRLGRIALPALQRAAHGADPRTRLWAATALGRSGRSEAGPFVLALMRDEDSRVRREAAVAAAKLRGKGAREALEQASGDGDRHVRLAALRGLGTLRDPASLEALRIARSDVDPEVRLVALRTLCRLDSPVALRLLAETLRTSKKVRMRAAAAETLAASGSPVALRPLLDALGDVSSIVRAAAVEGLAGRSDPRTLRPLVVASLDEEDPAIRALVASTVTRLGVETVRLELDAAIASGDPSRRERAREILAAVRGGPTPRPIDRWIPLLRSPDPARRRRAARELGKLGDPAALSALKPLLGDSDPTVVQAALGAIARIEAGPK